MNFLFTQNIIVARFARSVEWDFFVIFKHCELLLYCSSCEILKEKSQPFYSRNVK